MSDTYYFYVISIFAVKYFFFVKFFLVFEHLPLVKITPFKTSLNIFFAVFLSTWISFLLNILLLSAHCTYQDDISFGYIFSIECIQL